MDFRMKPTSQDVTALYYLIGEAVFMIQYLEGALSVSITLKKDVKHPGNMSKEEADNRLKKHQSLTLGKAIDLAKESNLYSDTLYNELKDFKEERNWLIHKFVNHNLDDIHATSTRDGLFRRIKIISNRASMLQRAIETDLLEFSESKDVNMSRVRAAIKQYQSDSARCAHSYS